MQLTEAIPLVARLIETQEVHCDYKHCCDLAETYRIYITGHNIAKKLIQYVPREDRALFEQRVRLTKAITPALSSSIRQPFNKVSRNDRIRKSVTITDNAGKQKIVEDMMKTFYGSAQKKDRGLDYWLRTRFLELEFIDPNSWVVVEWDTPANDATPIKPRPYEVYTEWARNFRIVNDEVKWLFVGQPIFYNGMAEKLADTPEGFTSQQVGLGGELLNSGVIKPAGRSYKILEGIRYTLYDEDVTVVYEQINDEYLKETGYVLSEGETRVKIGDIDYITRNYTPKVGYPTAFRIGYKRDEHTRGRTFVNPWHDALCYFDKSVKTVSELDLTMTLHAFPQKLQYVQQCTGISKEKRCNKGRLADGTDCTACKGSGYKIHTSAQDAILLPMPDSKEDMLDLEGLLIYKSPPIDILNFQNEYSQQLEKQAHSAVFNSQVFTKSTATSAAGTDPAKTATEVNTNMDSVYDALQPFTEKFSELWKSFVITFGILAGESLDNIEVQHVFPADYKLKSIEMLLSERFTATEAGAPGFLIETIDDDMADLIYAGDALGMAKYNTKRRFFPFTGSTPDEVVMLTASQYVLKEPKVLYSNFDIIFKELEAENPGFWAMTDFPAQRKLVEAKVTEYMDKIKAQAPVIAVAGLRSTNPAGNPAGSPGEAGTGGGNPGSTGGTIDKNPGGIPRPANPQPSPVPVS